MVKLMLYLQIIENFNDTSYIWQHYDHFFLKKILHNKKSRCWKLVTLKISNDRYGGGEMKDSSMNH